MTCSKWWFSEGTSAAHFHPGKAVALRITNPTANQLCANIYEYHRAKIACCAGCPVNTLASINPHSSANSTFIISGVITGDAATHGLCDPVNPSAQGQLRTWAVVDGAGAVGFPAQTAPLDTPTLQKLSSDCSTVSVPSRCSCGFKR